MPSERLAPPPEPSSSSNVRTKKPRYQSLMTRTGAKKGQPWFNIWALEGAQRITMLEKQCRDGLFSTRPGPCVSMEVRSERHNQESEVYFIKQTVGNSCGELLWDAWPTTNTPTGVRQAPGDEPDGRLNYPVNHDPETEDKFIKDAAVICWQFMEGEKIEVHFSPVALSRLWPETGGGHWMTGPSYK
ncbi:hypothetical protein SKAU_G00034520 [Synaphobranchus kaupii]|uniref:Uncharacterized protein n=1 Tax=Synaphobranchus kaupii TaxID=118154 RepID=A0A9Q1GFV0_SYNKA|nr:hypothetical protein SKAU_G00034520 [Synaphobranchus kaupii]